MHVCGIKDVSESRAEQVSMEVCFGLGVSPTSNSYMTEYLHFFIVVQGVPYSSCLYMMNFRSRKMKIPEINKKHGNIIIFVKPLELHSSKYHCLSKIFVKDLLQQMFKAGCIYNWRKINQKIRTPAGWSLQKVVNTNSSDPTQNGLNKKIQVY